MDNTIYDELFYSTIKEPKNVKLLYDLLNISSTRINKAVLFVTKNTLVCETIEDARIIAHEPKDKRKAYDVIMYIQHMCILLFSLFFYIKFLYKIIFITFSVFHWMDVFIIKMVLYPADRLI